MTAKTQTEKVIATNREAYHNYHILETYEAGIALLGTEVKSAREGRVNLKDAYAMVRDGQLWLLNAHISQYSHGNRQNHDPTRDRRLLMHKREIYRLQSKIQEKGLTLVPTKLYFKGALIKCELPSRKERSFTTSAKPKRARRRNARPARQSRIDRGLNDSIGTS